MNLEEFKKALSSDATEIIHALICQILKIR